MRCNSLETHNKKGICRDLTGQTYQLSVVKQKTSGLSHGQRVVFNWSTRANPLGSRACCAVVDPTFDLSGEKVKQRTLFSSRINKLQEAEKFQSARIQKYQSDWKAVVWTCRSKTYCLSASGKINKTSKKPAITCQPQPSLLCPNKIYLQIHICKTKALIGNT